MNARERDAAPLEPQQHETVMGLVRRLTGDISSLFRQEMALASAEFSRSMSGLMVAAGSILTGGAVLFAGFLVLLAAAVIGLTEWLEPWQAALAVGVVVTVIGVVMVVAGKKKLDFSELKPDRSVESLKRDKDVLMRNTR